MKLRPFHIVNIILLCFLTAGMMSCHDDNKVMSILDRADSLVYDYPDSVLVMLDSIREDIADCKLSYRMRYELLYADAQNKAYVDFTTDSLLKTVVEYYDEHGSANQRIKAHYLLGCVYRDLHEAPMTLQCYHDAIECADTLSEDCDYLTMMSIYGQMAELYHRQLMPKEEIQALKGSNYCAAKAGNVREAIKSIDLLIRPYSLVGDTNSIFAVSDSVSRLYKKYDMIAESASAYSAAIEYYLEKNNLQVADSLLLQMKKYSGWFNEDGSLRREKQLYNRVLAKYYAKKGDIEQAKSCFRKAINSGETLASNYEMAKLYVKEKNSDSAIYYVDNYLSTLESFLDDHQTQTMQQINGMYDYSRNQRIAAAKEKEADRNLRVTYIVSTAFLIILFILYIIYNHYSRKWRQHLINLNHQYLMAVAEYSRLQADIELMGDEYKEYRQRAEDELITLRSEISNYQSEYEEIGAARKELALMQSQIMDVIKAKLPPVRDSRPITDRKWNELKLLVQQCLPVFYAKISAGNILSHDEMIVAILTRLKFSPMDISIIMEKSTTRISNIRKSANIKLFNDESAKSFDRNIMN